MKPISHHGDIPLYMAVSAQLLCSGSGVFFIQQQHLLTSSVLTL